MDEKKEDRWSNWHAWDVPFILQYRVVCIIVLLLITGFFCFQLKNLKMAADPLEPMYPTGHPFLPVMKDIKEMAREPSMLVGILEVKTGDIYNKDTLHKIDRITKALMGINGIVPLGITSLTSGIDHLNNSAEGFSPEPVLGAKWPTTEKEFKALKRKIAVNPMGIGRYVSYDNTAVMITATLADMDQKIQRNYKQLTDKDKEKTSFIKFKKQQTSMFQANLLKGVRDIKKEVDDINHGFYFMGEEILREQMTEMGMRDIPMAGGVMLILAVIVLAMYFKTFQGVFIPLTAMILSILLCLGFWAWQGMIFNPMALLFPLALGLLSMMFSVMVLHQYYRLCNVGREKYRALSEAYSSIPVVGAMMSTGLVMLSLYVIDIPMIKDLGIMGMLWFAATFIVVVFMTPILISFFPMPVPQKTDIKNSIFRVLADNLLILSQGNGKYGILVMMIMVFVVGGFCFKSISVGNNTPGPSYIPQNHPWNQCFNRLAEKFIGPYQLLVYVRAKEKGGIVDPEAINAIGDFSKYLINEVGAKDSIAIDMMVKLTRATMMDGNPRWQTISGDKKQIQGLARMVMGRGGVESFIDKALNQATISPFFPTRDARHIDRYATMMQAYIDDHPSDHVEFSIGGGLLGMTKALNDGTRTAYKKAMVAAFSAVFILGILVTRSFLFSLLVSLTLAAAQMMLCTIMRVFDIPVSLITVPALVTAIGFGSAFGYLMCHNIAATYQGTHGINDLKEAINFIIFMGMFVFAIFLPWFFIDMKFQSSMATALGLAIMIEAIAVVLCMPVFGSLVKMEVE